MKRRSSEAGPPGPAASGAACLPSPLTSPALSRKEQDLAQDAAGPLLFWVAMEADASARMHAARCTKPQAEEKFEGQRLDVSLFPRLTG